MSGEYKDWEAQLVKGLQDFSNSKVKLSGLSIPNGPQVLARQFIDSLRRTKFVRTVSQRPVAISRLSPGNDQFDPLRAAIRFRNQGNMEEAFWITFLATHCGKVEKFDWRLCSALYGGLTTQPVWTWNAVSNSPQAFSQWLATQQAVFLDPKQNYKFSNHRKYESLNTNSEKHTGVVVETYVNWIMSYGSHRDLLLEAHRKVGQNPESVFDYIYSGMDRNVARFGRLGAFDHVCMLGKLDLAPVAPGSTYLSKATGPKAGARLLIDGKTKGTTPPRTLEAILHDLGTDLGVGMQEMEDALCNWQKSPSKYVYFKG